MADTEQRTVDRRKLLHCLGTSSIVALAGCTGGDGKSKTGSADKSANQGGSNPKEVSVKDDATWRTAQLTDVTTGKTFRIKDLDRPAILHTFARGCAACHSQQGEFKKLYSDSGNEVAIIDITIDPNDDPGKIQAYAKENGFDWRFGSPPKNVIGSLVEHFGQEVTVSAASPVIIVCPDGGTYRLDKVVDSTDLKSAIENVC